MAVELFREVALLRGMVGILSLGRERQTKNCSPSHPMKLHAKELQCRTSINRWILPFTDSSTCRPCRQLKVIYSTEQDPLAYR